MATYAHNQNFRPLPPQGNYPQGYHLQVHPQHQQHQHQQPGLDGSQRPPSFVGLPPIRRASTFGSSLGLTADEFSPSENQPDGTSPQRQQQQQTQQPPPQGAPSQSAMAQQQLGQFMPASQQSGQFVQNVYRPTQGAHGPQAPQGPAHQAQTWQLQGQTPDQNHGFPSATFQQAAMQGQMPQGAFAGAPGNTAPTMNGVAPQGRPMNLPPHMLPGNLMQRFHPQGGGWNLQESHLSEPLQPTSRHRHSPSNASSQQQQPFYGYDKETGLSSTNTSPVQRQKPQQTQQTHQQVQQTQQTQLHQQYQQAASQQPPAQLNQAPPTSQRSPAGPRPEGASLSRLQSHQSDLARQGAAPAADDGQNKRSSAIFSSLRGRFAGAPSEDYRGPDGGPRSQGGANGDDASVMSIMTEDTGQQAKANPVFGRRADVPTPDNLSYSHSKDSIVAHGSGTPLGERMPTQPSQFAPPKKMSSFFGIGAHTTPVQPGNHVRADMPRTSTSTNTTEHKHTGSIGGPPKKRFSALKGVFRSSPHDGPKSSAPSFTVRMPAQNAPQMQPPRQYQGDAPVEPQGAAYQAGPSPQPGAMNAAPAGPGPQPGPSNASSPALVPQPGLVDGQPVPGQERIGPATGLRQPGYSLQPLPSQQGPPANQNLDRKPAGGLFGFLRGRSDSKSQDTPQQGYPVGPGQTFPPGQSQFGVRMPLGPDGRPITGAGQQAQSGQFPPQSQLPQPGPPGPPDSLQLQGQMPGQPPMMPMPTHSGLSQGHRPDVRTGDQRLPMRTLPSQSSTQAQSGNKLSPEEQQRPSPALQQSQGQPAPQQESIRPVEPNPAGSIVDSPVSQHSQPATQFAVEQPRFQSPSPGSLTQPFTAPQPSPNQLYHQALAAQMGAAAPPAQAAGRKPIQPPTGSAVDGITPPGVESADDGDMRRPVSPSSHAQAPAPGIPGEEMERAARPQASAGTPFQSLEGRSPPYQSASGAFPQEAVVPPTRVPGSASGESVQGSMPTERSPSQQSNQPSLRPPTSQQGSLFPPGQVYPAGQSPWIASQSGAATPPHLRHPFVPGSARPNGVPPNAQTKEKEQSTLSRLLKGSKPSNPAAPAQKTEKEKSSKSSLISAFKRGNKQTDALGRPLQGQPPAGMQQFASGSQPRPQQQQQQQSRPGILAQRPGPQQVGPAATQAQPQSQPKPNAPTNQQGPPPQQTPRQVRPPPGPEPQYDQVPIPAGYGYVRGEGRLIPGPAPFYVGSDLPTGAAYGTPAAQVRQPGFPQQQWVQPGGVAPHVPPAGAPGQPALQQQADGAPTALPAASTSSQTPQQIRVQSPTPPVAGSITQERAQVAASQQPAAEVVPQAPVPSTRQPQPAPTAEVTKVPEVPPQPSSQRPTVQVPEPSVSPEEQPQPRPQPTQAYGQGSNVTPPVRVQYTVPAQTNGPPNPSAAQGAAQSVHGRTLSEDGISSLPSQRAGRVQPTGPEPAPAAANPGLAARSPTASPSPQPTPGWMVSPLPSAQPSDAGGRGGSRSVSPAASAQGPSPPTQHLTTPTQRVADDNIYDATPRQSQFPAQQQQQQQEPAQPRPQPQQQHLQQYSNAPTVGHIAYQQQQAYQPQQQAEQQYSNVSNHAQFAGEQRDTILINGPVEPKSAGLSHEVTRPKPMVETTPDHPAHLRAPDHTAHAHNNHNADDSDSDLESDSDMESPIIQSATIATMQQAGSTNNSPTTTAQKGGAAAAKDNVAIFERAKRKAEEQREAERRLVLEEKIPVFDADEVDHNHNGGRKREDEAPQMSATSYPGQEWNPYGEGGFEAWDE